MILFLRMLTTGMPIVAYLIFSIKSIKNLWWKLKTYRKNNNDYYSWWYCFWHMDGVTDSEAFWFYSFVLCVICLYIFLFVYSWKA